jgi:hypothetical protein
MMPEMNEEDRITRALEQAPAVMVPAEFTARVMARLPERKVERVSAGFRVRRTHYGRNAMLAGAALLLCCLLVAGHGGGTAWQLAEWMALTQLAGIALWCGLAWDSSRQ